MKDGLKDTLRQMLKAGSDPNAVLDLLIDDYAKYHVALVVVGGLFLLGLTVLSVVLCRRFWRAPRAGNRKWTFEKKAYFWFGAVSVVVALFMALIVAANVSNVANPRHGFSGSLGLLATPHAGSAADTRYQAYGAWLQSNDTDLPAYIQGRIDDRLAWQRPKAIICSALLVGLLVLTAGIWRSLIRKSRARSSTWKLKDAALLLAGVVAVSACLLLMLMVIGNTQASFAPIALTLFYG